MIGTELTLEIGMHKIKTVLEAHDSSQMWALREDVLSKLGQSPEIALERAYCYTEVFKTHVGNPWIINKALAFKQHLETMTLYIRSGDLLPGSICEIPGAAPVCPELGIGECEIYTKERPERVGYIDGKVPEEIWDFWEGKNAWSQFKAYRNSVFGQDIRGKDKAPWGFNSCQAHLSPEFKPLLQMGLSGILNQIEQYAEQAIEPKAKIFLKAAQLSTEALSHWITRYAELAETLAAEACVAEDAMRYQNMAEASRHIAHHAPETFYQAIMLIWYSYQAIHIEGNGYSCSPGRMDQLLYPYYQADVQAGILTDDACITLFENFLIKMKDNTFWGSEHNLTQGVTVGGSSIDGTSMTNELSWFMIKACDSMKLPEPLVWLRWHEKLEPEFFDYCLEVISNGTCFPLMMNDAVVVEMLMNRGVSKTDAYDYVAVGCNEIGIPGRLYYIGGCSYGYMGIIRELMTQAKEGVVYASFAELFDEVMKRIEENLKEAFKGSLQTLYFMKEYKQVPLTSVFFEGALETGIDCSERVKYNSMVNAAVLFPNFIDCLHAIRTCVFDDQSLTLAEIARACEADFVGFEDVRKKLLAVPKHGQNDPAVGELVRMVSKRQQEASFRVCTRPDTGEKFYTNCVTRSAGVNQGRVTPATPDGRKAFTPLASSVVAAVGCETEGPTAAFNSTLDLMAAHYWCGGYNANIRLANTMLKNPLDRQKVALMLNVFFENGGQEMQINSVDSEILKKAQENPEAYRDIVVRIAGFSEFFVYLCKEQQDEIIARESHCV